MVDLLGNCRDRLISLHIFCAFAILLQKVACAYGVFIYGANMLMMLTVPFYNFTIYASFFDVVGQEQMANVL